MWNTWDKWKQLMQVQAVEDCATEYAEKKI